MAMLKVRGGGRSYLIYSHAKTFCEWHRGKSRTWYLQWRSSMHCAYTGSYSRKARQEKAPTGLHHRKVYSRSRYENLKKKFICYKSCTAITIDRWVRHAIAHARNNTRSTSQAAKCVWRDVSSYQAWCLGECPRRPQVWHFPNNVGQAGGRCPWRRQNGYMQSVFSVQSGQSSAVCP